MITNTIKTIIDKAPKGATHCYFGTGIYYKVDTSGVYFFSEQDNQWKRSLARTEEDLVPLTPKKQDFVASLPEHVRPHVTEDPKTKELTLWDETGAYEVCKSHYPLVLVAAMEVYDKEYLNKH